MFVVVVGPARLKLLVMLVNDKYWHFYCYILQCCSYCYCYTMLPLMCIIRHTPLLLLHNYFPLDLTRSDVILEKATL